MTSPVGSSVPGDTEKGDEIDTRPVGNPGSIVGDCGDGKHRVGMTGDTTPISDEAARALLVARYGEPPVSADDDPDLWDRGFLRRSYDRARAELAAARPLLVSAEAERANEPKLCGVLGYYGAKNEPLACGWTWHSGDRHSWSSLAVLRAAGGQEKHEVPRCQGVYPNPGRAPIMVRCPQADGHVGVCGPAAPVERERRSAVDVLFSAGPDTSIRTTWHDGTEYWEVPAEEMRAALEAVPAAPVGGQAEPGDEDNGIEGCTCRSLYGVYHGPSCALLMEPPR